ncbi:MAG: DUF1513 domain-containing protein [Candidatus Cybelea sp.]
MVDEVARDQKFPELPRASLRLGAVVGPTRSVVSESRQERYTVDILDLDVGEAPATSIPLDFFGHGLAMHPRRPAEAALFEKRGSGGCLLDLATRKMVRPLAPMKGHAFYGHAAYSREGDALFVVETNLDNKQGVISIRDSTTFDVLDSFLTYGVAPHDCHLVEDGRTLVIANGGGSIDSSFLPSVTFVDVNSWVLLEKFEVLDRNRNVGHVAVAANREFAAVSAPRDGLPPRTALGGVSLRRHGQPLAHVVEPTSITTRLIGESLSVAIHGPSRAVVATHPDADLITFWSLDSGALVGKLEVPGPRGVTVTLDERLYIVSYGRDGRVALIQADPVQVLPYQLATGVFGGAHLYTWAG